MIARYTIKDLCHFTDTVEVNQKLQEDVFSTKPPFISATFLLRLEASERAPLIPRTGKRPAFVAGSPVQLRRLAVTRAR